MAFTEIAVAVITAGPAYIAVYLAARTAQGEPAQPRACAQHAICEQCEDRSTADGMPSHRKAWALAS